MIARAFFGNLGLPGQVNVQRVTVSRIKRFRFLVAA